MAADTALSLAVVDDDDHLEGVIVRGSLIAGLTTSVEHPAEDGADLGGVGEEEAADGVNVRRLER